jgi:hypothetical protein
MEGLNIFIALAIWLGVPIVIGYKRSYMITETPKPLDMFIECILFAIVLFIVIYMYGYMEQNGQDIVMPTMVMGTVSYALHLQTSLICYSFREFVAKRKLEKLNAEKLD